MRVAYVCTDPGIPVFGNKGASVHVQSVLGVLLARGAEVHLLTSRPGGEPPPHLGAVHLHRLPTDKATTPAQREVATQRTDGRVAAQLDALCGAERLDLVYERYSLWGRTATRWAHGHRVASVLEVNAPLTDEQATHRTLVDTAGAERVAAQAFSAADTVVCVSDAVADWVRARTTNPHRVHTVANGVDSDRIRPALTPPPDLPFTVGFVGTLKPWHGVDHLINAMGPLHRADPSYRLLVVGDGPEFAALRTQVRRSQLCDAVEMTGSVTPAEIPALLRRMHVAVAPYPRLAGFYFSPLKVYEYFAAGLPTVATDVGGLADVLDSGRLGVLVEPGDVAALSGAIAGLRTDAERRRRLALAVRAAAVDEHDWNRVVSRILALTEVTHGAF